MSDARLEQLISRIERLREERKGINDDIKDVFDEARGSSGIANRAGYLHVRTEYGVRSHHERSKGHQGKVPRLLR